MFLVASVCSDAVANAGCSDVVNMNETLLLDAMCSVTTRTHMNYKLLVLYRICYRVEHVTEYIQITNNKVSVNRSNTATS